MVKVKQTHQDRRKELIIRGQRNRLYAKEAITELLDQKEKKYPKDTYINKGYLCSFYSISIKKYNINEKFDYYYQMYIKEAEGLSISNSTIDRLKNDINNSITQLEKVTRLYTFKYDYLPKVEKCCKNNYKDKLIDSIKKKCKDNLNLEDPLIKRIYDDYLTKLKEAYNNPEKFKTANEVITKDLEKLIIGNKSDRKISTINEVKEIRRDYYKKKKKSEIDSLSNDQKFKEVLKKVKEESTALSYPFDLIMLRIQEIADSSNDNKKRELLNSWIHYNAKIRSMLANVDIFNDILRELQKLGYPQYKIKEFNNEYIINKLFDYHLYKLIGNIKSYIDKIRNANDNFDLIIKKYKDHTEFYDTLQKEVLNLKKNGTPYDKYLFIHRLNKQFRRFNDFYDIYSKLREQLKNLVDITIRIDIRKIYFKLLKEKDTYKMDRFLKYLDNFISQNSEKVKVNFSLEDLRNFIYSEDNPDIEDNSSKQLYIKDKRINHLRNLIDELEPRFENIYNTIKDSNVSKTFLKDLKHGYEILKSRYNIFGLKMYCSYFEKKIGKPIPSDYDYEFLDFYFAIPDVTGIPFSYKKRKNNQLLDDTIEKKPKKIKLSPKVGNNRLPDTQNNQNPSISNTPINIEDLTRDKELKKLLSDNNIECCIPINPDGDCFYNAILSSQDAISKIKSIINPRSNDLVKELRDYLADSLEVLSTKTYPVEHPYYDILESFKAINDKDKFIEDIRKKGIWINDTLDIVLPLTAYIFGVPIDVYITGNTQKHSYNYPQGNNDTIALSLILEKKVILLDNESKEVDHYTLAIRDKEITLSEEPLLILDRGINTVEKGVNNIHTSKKQNNNKIKIKKKALSKDKRTLPKEKIRKIKSIKDLYDKTVEVQIDQNDKFIKIKQSRFNEEIKDQLIQDEIIDFKEVKADGNCFYESILASDTVANRIKEIIKPKEENVIVEELRNYLSDYLKDIFDRSSRGEYLDDTLKEILKFIPDDEMKYHTVSAYERDMINENILESIDYDYFTKKARVSFYKTTDTIDIDINDIDIEPNDITYNSEKGDIEFLIKREKYVEHIRTSSLWNSIIIDIVAKLTSHIFGIPMVIYKAEFDRKHSTYNYDLKNINIIPLSLICENNHYTLGIKSKEVTVYPLSNSNDEVNSLENDIQVNNSKKDDLEVEVRLQNIERQLERLQQKPIQNTSIDEQVDENVVSFISTRESNNKRSRAADTTTIQESIINNQSSELDTVEVSSIVGKFTSSIDKATVIEVENSKKRKLEHVINCDLNAKNKSFKKRQNFR